MITFIAIVLVATVGLLALVLVATVGPCLLFLLSELTPYYQKTRQLQLEHKLPFGLANTKRYESCKEQHLFVSRLKAPKLYNYLRVLLIL